MAVICASCGEELLGAVNRCWKCGREVLSTPDAATAPPVRSAPLPATSPASDVPPPSADAVEVSVADATDKQTVPPPVSPTDESPSVFPATIVTTPTARPTSYQQVGIAPWLAIVSVILGLSSMALGALSPWALLLAGGGLVCGIVGLNSRRRITATIGLLLCLMGVTAGSGRLAYDTFLFIRGEPIAPVEPLPEDDLLLDPFDSTEPADPLE